MHGAATPRLAAVDAQAHSGLLDPYSKHRRFNSAICASLAVDHDSIDLAKAIGNCATVLGLEIDVEHEGGPKALLRAAKPCNRRLCPFCEWRRAKAWRRRFFEGLPSFHEDFPTHKPVFLTLTVKNCPINDLRSTISHMHSSWRRMHMLRSFPTKFWFRRTEVTHYKSENSLSVGANFHPHMHVVLFVPSSYFSHGYIRQNEWRQWWQMAARLDYSPIVDVRRGFAKSRSGGRPIADARMASIEITKYATKATDLIAMGSDLGEFNRQVKGLRLSASSRSLRPYIADTPMSESDLVDKGMAAVGETYKGKAVWFEDVGEYLFSEIL